ncbi:MAG: YgfZ/GcvT domain-containing protein [Candidatus Binataceae bacterium]
MQNSEPIAETVSVSSGSDSRTIAEYRALQRGAGVRVVRGRKVIRVVGDDRVSFLHGMCSNDIKNARAGTIVPALFLTEHAHVIADFFAWVAEDSILIEIDAVLWARAREQLERLLVADDVEFEGLPDLAVPELVVIDVEGPRAAQAVATVAVDAATLAQWRHLRAGDVFVGNLPRFGSPASTILLPADHADSILAGIEALGADFQPVSESATEIIRVENGVAKIGVDTTDKTIALEARLNRAISFEKGCYLGQETIERATARGGLKKRLFGLRFEGDRAPEPGAAARLDGKEVGVVTSIAMSPRFGAIGLAILHHSAWETGTKVVAAGLKGEVVARVSDLPFN